MVTAHATVATAVEAMRHGAFDYIEKPFDADQLERLVAQAMRHGRLMRNSRRRARRPDDGEPPAMIGSSPPMQALRARSASRPHAGNRAHHRRKRHRQGAGRPGDPRRQPTAPPRRWSASIAPCSRRT